MTDRLTDQDTGRWLITTQGSVHVWDLDAMTWVRKQMDGLNPMLKDGKPMHLLDVVRWPQVGDSFYVYCSERPQGMRTEWHQSSTIKSIEEVCGAVQPLSGRRCTKPKGHAPGHSLPGES